MAAPSYATDLNDIFTNGGASSWYLIGGGRETDPETDDFIMGTSCWSHDPFSSGIEGGLYPSSETINSDDAVYVWTKCDVAATLATHAAGGIQVCIGNLTTAYYAYYVLGKDDYAYGGWVCIPVDPALYAGASTTVGSPTPGTNAQFGVRWNVPSGGASKGYPMKVDAMRHGRQIEVTAGDSGTPATWDSVAAYDGDTTRMWGICQPTNSGAALQGLLYWGTGATAVYSRDSNRTIVILDTEWTVSDFTQIIFPNASNDVVWDNIGLIALGTNNRGIIDVTVDADITWTNSVFQDIDTTFLLASSVFDGSKWIGTNEIETGGASMKGCQVLLPTVSVGSHAVSQNVAYTDTYLDDMTISKGTAAHHAISFGTAVTASLTLRNIEFTGFGSTDDSNDSTVEFLATTGSLTLSLEGCTVNGAAATTGNFSVDDAAGIAVTLSIDPVATSVHVNDENGDDLQGAVVYLEAKDATGDLPFEETVTIARSGTVATVTHTAHGLNSNEYVNLQGITNTLNSKDNWGAKQITWISVNSYSYVTLDEGDTVYTGTIKATGATIYGTTDANGDISTSRTYALDQPLKGRIRKSSTSPRYKSYPLDITVDATDGVSVISQMILDE